MAQFFLATILFSLVHSTAFLKLTFGAEDTLLHNQTIAVGQILVSENQVFEVGFFHPQSSRNVFMGIWYKATPDVVVWVANRNNPITHSQGVELAVSQNGTLAISRGGSVIWSANPLGVASSHPVVRLLDTGNLVVVDETREGYLWQSFDHPTDTMLPGMKLVDDVDAGVQRYLTSWRNSDDPSPGDFIVRIDNEGLPELVILRGKVKIFRTGKWNGLYFNGVSQFPIYIRPEMVYREDRLISITDSLRYDSSVITRRTLHISGLSHRYTLNARKSKWSPVFSFPRDQCDQYGHCGPNGICTIENAQPCACFRGFSPKFQNDWDLQDWSGGCTRITPLNCQSGDSFQEVKGVKYPDMLRFSLNTSMSLDECKAECLKNCSCTACANPHVGSGCVMWYGDLLDTRALSAADNMQNIYIRIPVSELDIATNLEEEEKKWPIKIILISLAAGVLVSTFINGGILQLRRRKNQALTMRNEDIELPLMKMATVLEATNNFSGENRIGAGGFGSVYRGSLSTGEQIAVKRLSRSSGQGVEEFKNEVVLIAKLQHRNLVRLLGCCIEGVERVLVYEYLQNKSLDYFIFDRNQRTVLTWPKRFEIIMGVARGLLYLHHDSRLKIIHRDLKTSNILLDANLNPKISDFGLARTFEEDQSIARTRTVVGTYGYMSPEYAIDGKFSVKSDIFSLGVVLLEIISGKKNRGFEHNDHDHSLLGHAWLLWKEKRSLEVMDECLNDTYMESQVKRCIQVGLLCVQKLAEDRPTMPLVVMMLASDGEILPEPKEPGFFIERRSSSPARSCSSRSSVSVNDSLTITDLEAR